MQKEANDYLIVRSGNFVQIAKGFLAISQATTGGKDNPEQKMYAGTYYPQTDIFVTTNGLRVNMRKAM